MDKALENVDTNFSIDIASIIIKNGQYKKAIEILFEIAKHKENKIARQRYVACMLLAIPDDLFEDPETVTPGSFVMYKLGNERHIVEVDKSSTDGQLHKNIVGKSKGDSFILTTNVSLRQLTGVIELIMNRYTNLLQEILREAESPHADLGFEVIKFAEDNNTHHEPEALINALREHFGAHSEFRTDAIQKEFDRYYANEISYSQLAQTVFAGNQFEAYVSLTSTTSNLLRAIPTSKSMGVKLDPECRFIIDIPTSILFFELSREFKTQFQTKFVIPNLLLTFIEGYVSELRLNRKPKMSLDISTSRVTASEYPEKYHENRLAFFSDYLDWIKSNCEAIPVVETLDVLSAMNDDAKEVTPIIQYLFDNLLLSQQEDFILLTCDTFYCVVPGYHSNKVQGPTFYLANTLADEDYQRIRKFMLQRKFVGLDINRTLLQEEFIKLLSNRQGPKTE